METPTENGCNLSSIDQTLPAESISYICNDFVPNGSIHLEVLRRQHINDGIFSKKKVNSRLISVDKFLTANVYRLILLTYASALYDRLAVS